jgi:hypothetical protein
MFNRSMRLKGNENLMVLSNIKGSYFGVKGGSL